MASSKRRTSVQTGANPVTQSPKPSNLCSSRKRASFYFFQAEDGIRDIGVTGVQTCALPIFCTEYSLLRQRPSGLVHHCYHAHGTEAAYNEPWRLSGRPYRKKFQARPRLLRRTLKFWCATLGHP